MKRAIREEALGHAHSGSPEQARAAGEVRSGQCKAGMPGLVADAQSTESCVTSTAGNKLASVAYETR